MQLIGINTGIVKPGDDLAALLAGNDIRNGDIITVSSKVIAVAEGNILQLKNINPSAQARKFAEQCGRSAAFCQAVIDETKRLHGRIVGSCPGALLTEVRPDGLQRGVILTANAGLDESNVEAGTAVGWPVDCASSAQKLRLALESSHSSHSSSSSHVAVIITDSCCLPRRWGVIAFALAVSGLDPLASQVGKPDLFGKSLTITTEAIADQLATAGNMLMGNAGQSVPACIIRDHGIPLSNFSGWVDGIEPEEDLFKGIFNQP